MCVVEVILEDKICAVEVILEDKMCAVDDTVLADEVCTVEVILDDVDDSSFQSLTTTNRFSFTNRQSKCGFFCMLRNCKLGNVVKSSVAFIEII